MDNKLVSIVIVSYNSEDFIIEVLESAKAQTYKNLELIISDDGSTDWTIEKIENWLLNNKDRFEKCRLIKSDKNTGITPNLNRGVMATTGKYIKLVAADDVLLDNCVEDLLYFLEEKEISFCFSRALPFGDSKDIEFIQEIIKGDRKDYDFFFNKSQKNQYHALLRLTIPLSIIIGGFYSKSILEEIKYFNETYEMMEDYPFMISLAKLGYKFELLDEYTAKYRVRDIVDRDDFRESKRFISHYKNLKYYRKNEIIPLMKKEKMYISVLYLQLVMVFLQIEYKNKNNTYRSVMMFLRKTKQTIMKLGKK